MSRRERALEKRTMLLEPPSSSTSTSGPSIPRCAMVVEDAEPCDSEQATLLAEMQALQSMLAALQVERQSLSAALSERLQVECNRAKSMTRVLKHGKRSSDHEPPPVRKAPGSVSPDGGGSSAAAEPAVYRSSDLGLMSAQRGAELADGELEEVVDSTCEMTYDDDLHHGPPTYRSCSNGALADYDDAEWDEQWDPTACDGPVQADAFQAEVRGLLDPSLDPSQVDISALRELVAKLGALVEQGVAMHEEELSKTLSQLSKMNVLSGHASSF